MCSLPYENNWLFSCTVGGMLLLDGISLGGYDTQQRGFTHVIYVPRLSSLCARLTSTQFWSIVVMCLSARVVVIGSRPTKASTDTRSFVGCKHHHRKSFCNFYMWGEGEERKWTVLSSSRKRSTFSSISFRNPFSRSSIRINYIYIYFFSALNNHIHLLLYEEIYFHGHLLCGIICRNTK